MMDPSKTICVHPPFTRTVTWVDELDTIAVIGYIKSISRDTLYTCLIRTYIVFPL